MPKALEQYLPKNKNYDFATNEGVINYNKAILKALGKHIAATPIKTTAEKPINIAEHLEKNRLGKFLYLSTQSFFSQFPKRVNNTSGTASPHMTNKDYQKAYDMAFDTRYWGMPFLDSFEKIRHQPEEQ